MSLSDPIGDLLTRIRNGQHAGKTVIESPSSKVKASVLEVLKREGFIRDYSIDESQEYKSQLKVELKYHEGGPAIKEITRVSKAWSPRLLRCQGHAARLWRPRHRHRFDTKGRHVRQ